MVLQYSNQETSVTIGESVRDEDGSPPPSPLPLPDPLLPLALTQPPHPSLRAPIHRPRGHQRRANGAANNNQRVQNGVGTANHSRDPELPVRAARQKRQVAGADHGETDGKHAADGRVQPRHHDGPTREPDPGLLQRPGR